MFWIKIAGKLTFCGVLLYISSTAFFSLTSPVKILSKLQFCQASATFQFVCLRYEPKIWANYIFGAALPNTRVIKFIDTVIGQNFK